MLFQKMGKSSNAAIFIDVLPTLFSERGGNRAKGERSSRSNELVLRNL